MTRTTFAFLFAGVMLNAVAQLALKAATRTTGALTLRAETLGPTFLALASQPYVWLGLACYGVSVLVWIIALSRVDVSIAYPMLSLGYIVTAVAAWLLFGEALGLQRVAAIAVIIIGVYLLARA
jgi:multidrug transporter EmrE-like cation transporter